MRCLSAHGEAQRSNPCHQRRFKANPVICSVLKPSNVSNSVLERRAIFIDPQQCSWVARASRNSLAAAEDMITDGAEAVVGQQDSIARQFALACAEVVDDAKCQNIKVLHVAPMVSWTSFMVFATVFSRPQLLAAMARLERMVDEEHPDRQRQNQPGSSPWECLDYGDVVIHLFTDEQRQIYDVEGFYAQAPEVSLPWAPSAPPATGANPPTWTTEY